MRNYCLGVIVAACAAISPASADDKELFSRVDKDGDGFVTQSEIEGEGKPLFARLLRLADKNSDKKLTKEEFEAGLKPDADKFEMSPGAMTPGPGARTDMRP